MSATDKEQHTDTEKNTDQVESQPSANESSDALESPDQFTHPMVETEDPSNVDQGGTSIGNSSDSTPPTTIECPQMSQSFYFQVPFLRYCCCKLDQYNNQMYPIPHMKNFMNTQQCHSNLPT